MYEDNLPCIVCGKNVELSKARGPNNWAATSTGVVAHAAGNYGSTLFDPMDVGRVSEFLRIVICDDCLEARSSRVQYVKAVSQSHKIEETKTFTDYLGTDSALLSAVADTDVETK